MRSCLGCLVLIRYNLKNFVNASKDYQKNFISFQLNRKSDFSYFWNDINW